MATTKRPGQPMNDSVTIPASYLSDALGDLAAATVLIASGLDEAR